MERNSPYPIGGPVTMVQGASTPFICYFPGTTAIGASPTAVIRIKGSDTDLSATNLSGSASTNSVDTITTPTVQALLGGETYVLAITGTLDGRTDVYLVEIQVLFPWMES